MSNESDKCGEHADEKLVMTCEICGSEMIALHGFFVTCPNCDEQNESCQGDENKKSRNEFLNRM